MISSLPCLSRASQAQPEPNSFAALSENSFLKFSTPPKSRWMALSRSPFGSPPPVGDMQFQKNEWFHAWPALLNIGPAAWITTVRSGRAASGFPSTRPLRFLK